MFDGGGEAQHWLRTTDDSEGSGIVCALGTDSVCRWYPWPSLVILTLR